MEGPTWRSQQSLLPRASESRRKVRFKIFRAQIALRLSKFSIFMLKFENHRKVHLDHNEGEVDGPNQGRAILWAWAGGSGHQV
jgi:hypothetical protein